MNMPATSNQFAHGPLQRLALPRTVNSGPGPINTIALDREGNIYYTDEINHSVVCLDRAGTLQWHKTELGASEGRFRYPKGLSLGWIKSGGHMIRCVAVCDSWNHRLQILDACGNIVHSWTNCGKVPLAEVTDVRFIPGEMNPEQAAKTSSYWLVLDKGNHRLCGLNHEGGLIFHLGHCFPPTLESRWTIPGMFLEKELIHSRFVREFPPFDFAYHPERILGESENALYLWEPYSRRLKSIVLGCLLPMHINSERDIDWISADQSGIIGWVRDTHRLIRYDCHGRHLQEIEICGRPVPSNLPLNEFWLQKGDIIERWQWAVSGQNPTDLQQSQIRVPLLRSAHVELSMLDVFRVTRAVAGWVAQMDGELALADMIVATERESFDREQASQLLDRLHHLIEERRRLETAMCDALFHWHLGLLECRLLGCECGESSREIAAAQDQWELIFSPIRGKFPAVQDLLDDLFRVRFNPPDEANRERSREGKWKEVSTALETDLEQVLEGIYRWSGIIERNTRLLPLRRDASLHETPNRLPQAPGHWICRQVPEVYDPTCPCLHEVDRIPVGSGEGLQNPIALALSSGSDLFVSLLLANQILHLNAEGKEIERIGRPGKDRGELQGPTYLAVDSSGRLWVSEFQNHRIQIFDLKRDSAQIVGSYGSQLGQFHAPFGIGARPDGSMLVVDTGNRRIVRITAGGNCEVFSDRIGRASGELLEPICLCPGSHDSLWLVDRRNHRIQKLDAAGRWSREIGGCGLGAGYLFFPESVAEFEDGTIAVAQNRWNRSVKLFSQSGEELGKMMIDYFAVGMLVRRGQLLIADIGADVIRVYERIPR